MTKERSSSMLLAGLQMNVTPDIKNNLAQILTGIREAAQRSSTINAQSGVIEANGERSLRVPVSGVQFFKARIHVTVEGDTLRK